MTMIAHIPCSILPPRPHHVGTRGPDRFGGATECPLYEVVLPSPVALSRDPVSEREYAPFDPAHATDPGDLPVVGVSWHDANAFCAWLGEQTGYAWRLPSEAEWEIGCRAGTDTPFSTGNDLPTEAANYLYNENAERIGSGGRTPRNRYAPNPWGLCDMHGNVAEWCADAWHSSHEHAARDGSARGGVAECLRVIRGGSWDLLPRLLRSSSRDALPPETRRDNLGFRLAVTLPT